MTKILLMDSLFKNSLIFGLVEKTERRLTFIYIYNVLYLEGIILPINHKVLTVSLQYSIYIYIFTIRIFEYIYVRNGLSLCT